MHNKREKIIQLIFKLVLLFILIQPLFDVLSFLDIRQIIPVGISTYVKPIFVFGIGLVLLFLTEQKRILWILYWGVFGIYAIIHCLMLLNVGVLLNTVLHEARFIINIMYMNMFFMDMWMIYSYMKGKKEFKENLQKVLFWVTIIYSGCVLLTSVLGVSARTYEYSDANKLGLKGIFDSGQILGHVLSILFLFSLAYLREKKMPLWVKLVIIAIPTAVMWNLGTKVPYFMTIICSIVFIMIEIFVCIQKKKRISTFILIPVIIMVTMLCTIQYSPVQHNISLNATVGQIDIDSYDIDKITGLDEYRDIDLDELHKSEMSEKEKFLEWDLIAKEYLREQIEKGVVHPSAQRQKQKTFNIKKYELVDWKYKIMGIGYLSSDSTLTLESDVLMTVFCFGVFGFLMMLGLIIVSTFKVGIKMLINIREQTPLTLGSMVGMFAFLGVSYTAGYTYIYTNFSIFLVCLVFVLKANVEKN